MALGKQHTEEFAQFFENPTRPKFRELVKENIGEANYIDFKESWPNLPDVARHILGFGNLGGGAMVIGVKEHDNGELEAVGIEKIKDKTEVGNKISQYIPNKFENNWIIINLNFRESEYAKIQGKKFQVILIEGAPNLVPLVAEKDGQGIERGRIYIRRSASTEIASYEDLTEIIQQRLEADQTAEGSLTLSGHLNQLKILYKEMPPSSVLLGGISPVKMLTGYDPMEGYKNFLEDRIEKKKARIDRFLDL